MKKMPTLTTAMTPFPYSVDLDASFDAASELMGRHNVRHLPVTRDHQVVGVITDRDLTSAIHVHSQTGASGDLNVSDLYMADPYIVSVDEPLDNVLLTMAERHIGSAIVTRAGKLVGMFTTVDACRSFGEYLRKQFPHPGDDAAA
ncbi:MAG TPA: CBS domain-containing protein [Gammaproteobacteria bacterium]|nr:CBS domain-containing protein [Gammaproteobacteria bacterium]